MCDNITLLNNTISSEEEGSNFNVTLLGSKVFTNIYTVEDLKKLEKRKE